MKSYTFGSIQNESCLPVLLPAYLPTNQPVKHTEYLNTFPESPKLDSRTLNDHLFETERHCSQVCLDGGYGLTRSRIL